MAPAIEIVGTVVAGDNYVAENPAEATAHHARLRYKSLVAQTSSLQGKTGSVRRDGREDEAEEPRPPTGPRQIAAACFPDIAHPERGITV